MLPTPEQAQAILDAPASCGATQQLKSIAALTIQAVDNVLVAEESGQIDAETAQETIEDILTNQMDLQATALHIPMEEIAEEIENVIIVGSPAEDFGTAFTALIATALIATELESLEEGVAMVSQHTGIDRQTLWNYCNNNATPTPDEAIAIAECFETCHADPDAVEHLVSLADDGMSDRMTAEFNAVVTERQRIDWENAIGYRLKQIEHLADKLYADRRITPEQRRRIMPEGIPADERANFNAFFSATTERMGISPEEYLGHVEFTLNFLAQSPQIDPILMTDFSAYVDNNPEPIDKRERQAVKSFRANHSYG